MLLKNRVIWDDNGTLKDLTVTLSDIFSRTQVLDFKSGTDALYLGSDLPFNHRYIQLATANSATAKPQVAVWDGSNFQSVADTLDLTETSSGVTLASSDILEWIPDEDHHWHFENTTEDIPALSSLKIYDLYWIKLTFDADLDASTELSYVGHRFSDDNILNAYYPDLNTSNAKTAFESGKSDWNEQHVMAAEHIIRNLRARKRVVSRNQILNWQMFSEAAVHKVAEMIFSAFGNDFNEQRQMAKTKFDEAIRLDEVDLDKDRDARLDQEEIDKTQRLWRV